MPAKKGICSVAGCNLKVSRRGLCEKHYRAQLEIEDAPQCRIPSCTRAAIAKGLCRPHYQAARRRGITTDDFVFLMTHQKNKCAICYATPDPADKHTALCVDHNHRTGAVRGLLCHSCNKALGGFGDNPDTLRNALKYLENPPINALREKAVDS